MSVRELPSTYSGAMPALQDRVLLFTRVFNAPRRLVFHAWTDPKQLVQWFGPEGFSVAFLEMDVRPGGAWRKCMRSPEGVDYWRSGIYLEVVEPERLVFTYISDDPQSDPDHETIVTIILEDLGAKTLMTFRQQEFDSIAARDSHQSGWTSCMERFAAHLEQT
jgi:uncharacterized protein YndB with AHSA1/START domain